MTGSLTVPECSACREAIWPPRPVCPRCGGTEFAQRSAGAGLVEETTRNGDVALASVRCEAGPVVIARLAGPAGPGATVALSWSAAPGGVRRVMATPAGEEPSR